MSRRRRPLVAALLALGLGAPFACKCPASSPEASTPMQERTVRQIDLNKRKALNLRQARKLTPADKLGVPGRPASGGPAHLPTEIVNAAPAPGPAASAPTPHQPTPTP